MYILRVVYRKLPDRFYTMLKNFQFRLRGISTRFRCNGGVIEVTEGDLFWTTHRNRAHLYSNGLLARGAAIGKSYLLEKIDFEEGDMIVDCGANMGDLQLWFFLKDINIEYLGIEPNPSDFECLSRNMLPSSSCLNIALWNENGSLKFWVDTESASSSLIEPPNYTKVINVNSVRIDELENLDRIKLLKVEGEGAEPEILLGATKLLDKIDYISVDVGPERGLEQLSTRTDVLNIMSEFKFNIVLENPYHRKTILFENSSHREV
jgi:FkbM family methyltransferase